MTLQENMHNRRTEDQLRPGDIATSQEDGQTLFWIIQ